MKNSEISRENLEWLMTQPIEMQYELFKNFVDIAKLHNNQLVEEEIKAKAGERYQRGKRYSRWGNNPDSIRIGEEKVPVDVPRLYDKEQGSKRSIWRIYVDTTLSVAQERKCGKLFARRT